jgi:hypothetical protein
MMDGIENSDNYLEVEREENGLLYLKGATFPFKGQPSEPVLEAVNLFKKLLKGRFAAKEIIEYILRYDWAYRVRFIDLCSETTTEQLLNHPWREINRLMELNKQRDLPEVHQKLKKFSFILKIALYLPKYRNLIKDLPTFDDIDLYWALQKLDYNIKGLTYQQRLEELERRGWKKVV